MSDTGTQLNSTVSDLPVQLTSKENECFLKLILPESSLKEEALSFNNASNKEILLITGTKTTTNATSSVRTTMDLQCSADILSNATANVSNVVKLSTNFSPSYDLSPLLDNVIEQDKNFSCESQRNENVHPICENNLNIKIVDDDEHEHHASIISSDIDTNNMQNIEILNGEKLLMENWNDVVQISINSKGEIEINNIGNTTNVNSNEVDLEVASNEETVSIMENDNHLLYINNDTQTQNLKYKCMVYNCHKTFNSYKTMMEHRESHLVEKEYRCHLPDCPWSFNSQYNLRRHEQSHKKIKQYQCPYANCNKLFSTSYNLNAHVKAHNENINDCKCGQCGKHFVDKRQLGQHFRKAHNAAPSYPCTYRNCDKKLYTMAALKGHMKKHLNEKKKEHHCPYKNCDKVFKKKYGLNYHLKSHTGDRPFKCDLCDWSFATNSTLNRHKRKHDTVKK